MLEKPSLYRRIAIGKTIGFIFGLAGLILLPFRWWFRAPFMGA